MPTTSASLLLGKVFAQPHAGHEKTVGGKATGMAVVGVCANGFLLYFAVAVVAETCFFSHCE